MKTHQKNIKKPLLTLTFLLLFVFFLPFSIQAKAANSDFQIKDGVLVKYLGNSKNVTIPSTVKIIGEEAFRSKMEITRIVIPDTVIKIRNSAFYGCTNLKEVKMSKKVTALGEGVFNGCKSLTTIKLPDTLTHLGDGAFLECSKLKNITIPPKITKLRYQIFRGCTSLTNVTLPNKLSYLGNSTFNGCTSLKSITIPSSVTILGNSAFYGCTSLTSITLPDKITMINGETFSGCTSLTKVTLPAKLTSIGFHVFSGCSSLANIIIPDTVISIDTSAFYRCKSLTSVTIPRKVTVISSSLFYECTSLKTVILPDTIASIEGHAFYGCKSLNTFKAPSSLKQLGNGAFEKTPWLKAVTKDSPFLIINHILLDASKSSGSVTVPKGVTTIGSEAFCNSKVTEVVLQEGVTSLGEYSFSVSSLKKITLPKGLTEIGDHTFSSSKISSITLPDSVKSIGNYAFYKCAKLKSIAIPEGVTSIGLWTFFYCESLQKITLPKSLTIIDKRFLSGPNSIKEIEVSPDNPVFSVKGAFLLNKEGTELYLCTQKSGEVMIPEGIKKVTEGAFGLYDNNKMTKVTFPSTLKVLADNVFNDCSMLNEIILPSSLVTYGTQLYQNSHQLRSFQIYEANDVINFASEGGVLYNADKTKLICNPASGDIVVPEQVTAIGDYAFPNTNDSVTFSNKVTAFDEQVFDYKYISRPANEEPFHVHGYLNSAAEKYCNEKGIPFLAFDRTYTITYVLDGGVNHPDNAATYTRDVTPIHLLNPIKEGYSFLYWYEDISVCEDGDCRGEKILNAIPKDYMGDIKVIAKWKKLNTDQTMTQNTK